MSEKKVSAFKGTKQQEEKLLQVIQNHEGQEGSLMPILQEAQEIYGYLPLEVQQIIAGEHILYHGGDLRCRNLLCTVFPLPEG